MEKQMKCAKLVEDLKRQIMSGEIRPGDKISSENVRQFASGRGSAAGYFS